MNGIDDRMLGQFGNGLQLFIKHQLHTIRKMVSVSAVHLHADQTVAVKVAVRRAGTVISAAAHFRFYIVDKLLLDAASFFGTAVQKRFHRFTFHGMKINGDLTAAIDHVCLSFFS